MRPPSSPLPENPRKGSRSKPKIDPSEARRRRLDRWRRPLVTRWDRIRAWVNMLVIDHAALRFVYVNLHHISDRAQRSAQPFPHHIRRFARDGGRTVVSLRGGQTFGSLPLEKEACEKAGLTFVNFVLRSRSLPSVEELHQAHDLIRTLDYPVLFHCKSGADRAGFMSVLYLVWGEGVPVREAMGQLSLRYGHIRQGKTGVLDAFFEQYLADTDGEIPLLEWIDTRYDRDAIMSGFRASSLGSLISDRLLRRE